MSARLMPIALRPGVLAYAMARLTRAPQAASASSRALYDGAELRTSERPGANDHERHPSRMGTLRVWRSGRQERA